jgi:decaprenylphospho-beta-D-ribofuranose 2-oxidase
MSALVALTLRAHAPRRVLDGFGGSLRAACRYAAPATVAELRDVLARARAERLSVAFRGAGKSYGDAAIAAEGIVVDTSRIARVHSWNPETGLLDAEPGITIEGIWRRTLMDGWWPAVVPGTMRPTLGGCLAMNIHGKNNHEAGPIGEHVESFELCTPAGDVLSCSPRENADVFHAAIGGLGLLGAFTRVRLRLKKVESGRLLVESAVTRDLDATFDAFEAALSPAGSASYLVGWTDCLARGRGLGRSVLHTARYLAADEDPDGAASFIAERQSLPDRLLGVPRALLWRLMRPFTNDFGVRLVNALKIRAARLEERRPYLQSHVAFAFLLDYVPDWRRAYGPEGLIQVQVFLPNGRAREVLRELLEMAQRARLPPYLGVMKRHRPDAFLLSHAVDGWSFAMDFRVTVARRAELWRLAEAMTERVLDAGGRFYFAKDAVVRPADVARAYGAERLAAFFAIKRRLDPDGMLASDLSRRAFPR